MLGPGMPCLSKLSFCTESWRLSAFDCDAELSASDLSSKFNSLQQAEYILALVSVVNTATCSRTPMREGRKAGVKTDQALCVCRLHDTYYGMHEAVEGSELDRLQWPTYVGKWKYGTLELKASIKGLQHAVN